jgi:high affinity sulfate transporter 1
LVHLSSSAGTPLQKVMRKVPYYVPILTWLPKYEWRKLLVRDILAGLVTGSLMVPQALAYALLAGMPPMHGLYTAFWPVLMYVFMGHSRQLSLGPDALVSTLFGAAVEYAPEYPLVLAQCLGLLTGLTLLVLGLLRLGFLDVVLSRPLLAGFVNAVAVEIIMEQSPNIFGIATPKGMHGWHKVGYVIDTILTNGEEGISRITALFGFGSIGALLLVRVLKTKLKPRWPNIVLFPELLLVAGFNIGISWGMELSKEGLITLGAMGSGFTAPTVPQFEKIEIPVAELFRTVLVITMIGFVESIVAAKIFADKHNYSVSANRELVAYGLSNLFGSFFGAWPTFGSLPRTVVADMAGAQSLVFSVITLIVVMCTILFLGPVFEHMPRVCGSAIIVVAAIGLVEVHDVAFLWKMRSYSSLCLFMFTFFLTVFAGVEVGVILSFIVSLFLVLKRVSRPDVDALGRVPPAAADKLVKYKGLVDTPDAKPVKGVAIIRINDPLFFANSPALKSVLRRIERFGSVNAHPSAKVLDKKLLGFVLHFGGVPSCDPSALYTIMELAHDLRKRNVKVVFVKLTPHLRKRFRQAGITLAQEQTVFEDTHTAVLHVLAHRPGNRVVSDEEKISKADVATVLGIDPPKHVQHLQQQQQQQQKTAEPDSSDSSDDSSSDDSSDSSSDDAAKKPTTASPPQPQQQQQQQQQQQSVAPLAPTPAPVHVDPAAALALGIASMEASRAAVDTAAHQDSASLGSRLSAGAPTPATDDHLATVEMVSLMPHTIVSEPVSEPSAGTSFSISSLMSDTPTELVSSDSVAVHDAESHGSSSATASAADHAVNASLDLDLEANDADEVIDLE